MNIHFYVTPKIIREARDRFKANFWVSPTSVVIEKALRPGIECIAVKTDLIRITRWNRCPCCGGVGKLEQEIKLGFDLHVVELLFLNNKHIDPYNFSTNIADWATDIGHLEFESRIDFT